MLKIFLNFIPSFFVIIILAFLGFKIFYNLDKINSQNEVLSVLIGKTAPVILTNTLNNNEKNFIINEKTKGPYLINFFSSWCVPCQYEAPYLDELSNSIDIYGIAYKDKVIDTNQFLESFGDPYLNIGNDKNGLIAIDWGVYGVPETFIVDSNNIVILRHAGPINKEILKKIIYPELKKLGL